MASEHLAAFSPGEQEEVAETYEFHFISLVNRHEGFTELDNFLLKIAHRQENLHISCTTGDSSVALLMYIPVKPWTEPALFQLVTHWLPTSLKVPHLRASGSRAPFNCAINEFDIRGICGRRWLMSASCSQASGCSPPVLGNPHQTDQNLVFQSQETGIQNPPLTFGRSSEPEGLGTPHSVTMRG